MPRASTGMAMGWIMGCNRRKKKQPIMVVNDGQWWLKMAYGGYWWLIMVSDGWLMTFHKWLSMRQWVWVGGEWVLFKWHGPHWPTLAFSQALGELLKPKIRPYFFSSRCHFTFIEIQKYTEIQKIFWNSKNICHLKRIISTRCWGSSSFVSSCNTWIGPTRQFSHLSPGSSASLAISLSLSILDYHFLAPV